MTVQHHARKVLKRHHYAARCKSSARPGTSQEANLGGGWRICEGDNHENRGTGEMSRDPARGSSITCLLMAVT